MLEDQIKNINETDTGGQHPEGVNGIVGNNAVIDVQRKNRSCNHKEIHKECCQQDPPVYPFEFHEGAEKPVFPFYKLSG